mmetsp:Transcript_5916/g.19592  ORF Transcript_5916/g.19592 Transcript_5916/m.19592 type:complete len:261 (+) Transcript_5916:1599-2381(+)
MPGRCQPAPSAVKPWGGALAHPYLVAQPRLVTKQRVGTNPLLPHRAPPGGLRTTLALAPRTCTRPPAVTRAPPARGAVAHALMPGRPNKRPQPSCVKIAGRLLTPTPKQTVRFVTRLQVSGARRHAAFCMRHHLLRLPSVTSVCLWRLRRLLCQTQVCMRLPLLPARARVFLWSGARARAATRTRPHTARCRPVGRLGQLTRPSSRGIAAVRLCTAAPRPSRLGCSLRPHPQPRSRRQVQRVTFNRRWSHGQRSTPPVPA